MIFAAIGHAAGDIARLDAVLHTLDEEGVQAIVNTGDSVVGGSRPNDVVDRLQARQIVSVQSESDRLVVRSLRKGASLRERLDPERYAAIVNTYKRCGSREIEYLRSLPRTRLLEPEGVAVALYHGAYNRQSDLLRPDTADTVLRRQREIAPAAVHVFGGEPMPFTRLIDGTLFVNPGWISGAPDGNIHFALVSTETEPATAELRNAPLPSAD